MKPKLIIIIMVAIIATACSTNLQTTGNYIDDIYYWPGDVMPEIASEDLAALKYGPESNSNLIIVSELETGSDGTKTLNNYIYADEEPDWFNDVQAYNIENMTAQNNDTVFIPADEPTHYIINNYYIEDDYSYAERIRRFHNPYYYSADPYWNMNFAWGYRPYGYIGYSSMYWDPWYYGGYNGGYYGGFYSGYYGYNSWYSPYYSPYYSYYPGYYGNYHTYPGYSNNKKNYYDGDRRSSRPNTTYAGAGVGRSSVSDNNSRSNQIVNKSATTDTRRSVVNRDDMTASTQKSATTRTAPDNTVLTEKRRSTGNADAVRTDSPTRGQSNVKSPDINRAVSPAYNTRTPSSTRSTYSTTAPATKSTTGTSGYTPSYNTPRTNTRATYNRSNTAQPTQSTPTQTRSSMPATGSSSRSYTIPSTSTTSRPAGTTTKSSTTTTTTRPSGYSTGSSTSPSRSTYTPPQSSSSSRSSSTPSSSSTRSSSPSSSGSSSAPARSSGSSSSGGSSSSHSSGSSSSGSRR